ncbi:MAG: carbon storage regulator [Planctomycetes bacterium]|nr:carbon storage regulator [Planctomycetota bacterium]
MLALTRRVGEEIVIGDPKKPLGVIRVVDIHGDKVRLSFDFPRDTAINRKELADQKAKQDDNGGAPPTTPGSPGNGSPPTPPPPTSPAP